MKTLKYLSVLTLVSQVSLAADAPVFTCSVKYKVQDRSRWEEQGVCPKTMHMTCIIDGAKKSSQDTDFDPGYQDLDINSVQKNISVVLYNDLEESGKRMMTVRLSRLENFMLERQALTMHLDAEPKGNIFSLEIPMRKQTNRAKKYEYMVTILECEV